MTRGSGDIPATVTTVAADGTTVQTIRGAPGRAHLRHIDALAGLALAAQRDGCRLQVTGAADDLLELIALAGLGEVLGVWPGRQAELREDRRPDEVVQPTDPPG